jgi:UDP-N-acetylglucosamine--N-acetylmuramyl-(pentapeptide) pyrophosphoryl-undecaprenol N-acetylglucosamine transferase
MTGPCNTKPAIAIACGGTGGHLFPGLAAGEALQNYGCEVALLVSTKEVDQEAIKSAAGMQVLNLPAVALQEGAWGRFLRGFWSSTLVCRDTFRKLRPAAVLGMGGFTSAAPICVGNAAGALTFLHESNSIPGRANRWLSPWVDEVFVGFERAARALYHQSVVVTGTPVRSSLKPTDPGPCRMALGLAPDNPVLLVIGGSQGASGINDLVLKATPLLASQFPNLQFIHLTGHKDFESVQAEYNRNKRRAVVRPFFTEMDLALGAATLAVSRAGASSLAEFAAMRLPSILIPYPYAADNHQLYNARALVETGAARRIDQSSATPELLAGMVKELLVNEAALQALRLALARWHYPKSAEQMAARILDKLGLPATQAFPDDEEKAFAPPPRPPLRWKKPGDIKMNFSGLLKK